MINEKRVQKRNEHECGDGPIIYWMNRDMRTQHNWALLYAQQLAREQQQPLIVVYNLVTSFLGGTARHLTFKVDALQEIEATLQKKEIPFFVLVDTDGKKSAQDIISFVKKQKAGAVVTDMSPLRLPQQWLRDVSQGLSCAVYEVDAHNIVPVWEASPKKEYAAYTFRPKIHKKLPNYIDEFDTLKKQKHAFTGKVPMIPWNTILPKGKREEIEWITPGEKAAQKQLVTFLDERMKVYATDRNDPNIKAQSDLSPYLHYGMISAQYVVDEVLRTRNVHLSDVSNLKKNMAKVDLDADLKIRHHAAAFIEELVVRRELSDNFCYYEPHYDSFEGFPDWAQKSLKKSADDAREYVYTKSQFEKAKTHDDLWNAAQIEMVKTGKMHGYMRMYWAKKILEWTKSPQEAQKIAIYLNDTYELDGRDPNGYAGIAWSIGGVHDRPWFDRPIFGQVRYMARSGCEKKFDVDAYIKKWVGVQDTLSL